MLFAAAPAGPLCFSACSLPFSQQLFKQSSLVQIWGLELKFRKLKCIQNILIKSYLIIGKSLRYHRYNRGGTWLHSKKKDYLSKIWFYTWQQWFSWPITHHCDYYLLKIVFISIFSLTTQHTVDCCLLRLVFQTKHSKCHT